MKANAPKRKVFQDALDLLAEDPVKDTPVAVNGIVSIPVEEILPFHNHPFRLYEGDRLEDMVQSIREYGVLNPVIVRKAARGYEMLAGHNRTNAAKIAGLAEVPAIVKTDLSDEDAYVYVIETNLLQRSFAELFPSEKAAVLVARYEKISSQGKRNDIRQEIEGTQLFATTEASTSTVITKVPVTARNKQHSNINKKKKEYGVFLSIDASEMKKLYDYKEVVIDAQYFSKRDIQTLHKKGVKVNMYLNVGSIENFRKYYKDYEHLAIGDYENWDEEKWINVSTVCHAYI